MGSIDLLHLAGLIGGALNLLQRGEVVIAAKGVIVLVDAQVQLDHPVDAARKLCGLVQVEATGEQGGVEEEPDQVLHGLVGLVGGGLLDNSGKQKIGVARIGRNTATPRSSYCKEKAG